VALHPVSAAPSSRGTPVRRATLRSAFQDFPTPLNHGSARRSAVGLLGSNTLFTRLKGYAAVLYTYQLRALRAARGRRHHEHSHSSLDLVYGRRRFPVGRKHAIHHRRYDPGFNYWSGRGGSPRNHVYAQSPTQAYLIAALAIPGHLNDVGGFVLVHAPGRPILELVLPWQRFIEYLAVVSKLLAQAEKPRDAELASSSIVWHRQIVAEALPAIPARFNKLRCLIGSAELIDQHNGLFPLIDLKEDDGLPVG